MYIRNPSVIVHIVRVILCNMLYNVVIALKRVDESISLLEVLEAVKPHATLSSMDNRYNTERHKRVDASEGRLA